MSDAFQILREFHAASFLQAYERCTNPPDQGLGTPGLICAAFSAELGLKELLRQRGIPFGREHRLVALLKLLPQGDADSIRAELAPHWRDFDAQLANANNAFVTWRYFFESPAPLEVNIKFVAAFARAILNRVGGACRS